MERATVVSEWQALVDTLARSGFGAPVTIDRSPVGPALLAADVVATFNDALLAGWAPGDDETLGMVADIVGVSPPAARAVLVRHVWTRTA